MVQRKTAKKGKGKESGAVDFASFMSGLQSSGAVTDITNRSEVFYKFGDYNLDRALGGGLPAGGIYAFQGPASSGKSLAGLEIAKSVISEGKRVAYFDTENKISQKALRMMGLANNEMFTLLTLDNLETALDTLMQMAESDLFGMVAIDSTDALTTDEQDERDIHEGSKVGGYKAKLFSEWMGKVSALASAHNCSILLVRQVRDNPGAMYGSPEVTSGGKAIEFYATTILRFGPNKAGNAEEDGKLAYQGANVTIKKMNQGAAPKDAIAIRFYIGDNKEWGIDKLRSVFDQAKDLGVLAPPTPTSHKYIPCDALCKELGVTPEEITFNGANNVMAALESDDAFFEALKKVVDDCDGKPVDGGAGDDEVIADFEELDD